jgi:hypothetical protein
VEQVYLDFSFYFFLLIGFNFFSFFLLDIYDYSFSFVEINVGFYGFWFCNCISGAGWILASKCFFGSQLGLVSCVCSNMDMLIADIESKSPN